jgi:ubiquinone/menaquinone biosynthesis C-methylase UbiE
METQHTSSTTYISNEYARYRPQYPDALFKWLSSLTDSKEHAWDCGTGTGQVATQLAQHFTCVTATDSSRGQILNTHSCPNIKYLVEDAEKSSIGNGQIDLITAACAVHWFNIDAFYKEAERVLKPNGVIAVWCYEYPWTDNMVVDDVLREFKEEVLGPYMPKELDLAFNHYRDLKFPFETIPQEQLQSFEIVCQWGADDVLNFLSTWKASITYKEKNRTDPKILIEDRLKQAWTDQKLDNKVVLPIYLKAGRKSHEV